MRGGVNTASPPEQKFPGFGGSESLGLRPKEASFNKQVFNHR